MFGKILSELRFMRQFKAENGLDGYLAYRMGRLRKTSAPITVTSRGQKLKLRPSGPDLSVARIAHSEFNVLAHLYPRDVEGVIIDAGGFIGTAALELSRIYPKARVITIEPSSENHALLKENTAQNPQIEVINAALTTDDAPASLRLQNRDTGAWGFSIAAEAGSDMEEVATLSITALMDKIGNAPILIFKMDVEGAETPLLTPGADWLARTNVLMIELHERIVPGCEAAFFSANQGRCVLATDGEKFISVGPGFFAD